ncbi:MAG: PHB depolymerase family esterase [bacterium]
MPETTRTTYASVEGTRDFVLYRPASFPVRRENRALVVMLHGCTQTADDFAKGTRMNVAADEGGFLVVYPEQTAAAHPQKCWNWYAPQQFTRDHGEAAIIGGLIDSIARAEGVGAHRIALVGMSAGAAMAANLAVAYPERYSALAMHSGIPALAASNVASALTAMRQGVADGDALGARAIAAMGSRARPIPVLVLHGADDTVVSPSNVTATVRQWAVVNSGVAGASAPVEQHVFPGVGHAWSGGSAEGTYTAPTGPDATGMIVAFLRKVGVIALR